MKTLLYNTQILTMNDTRDQFNHGAILIEDKIIRAIGQSDVLLSQASPDTELINLKDRWVLPGLINTHVHTSQQLARGLADDVDLLTWLRKRIWPYESNMDEEDSYVSSLLCGLELIRGGVTCFAEAGGQFVESMARAVSELGLRAVLSKSSMDMGEGLPAVWQRTTQEELDTQLENLERWHEAANGNMRVWFGIRTIFNASDDFMLKSKALADKHNVGVHMHVAEVPEEIAFSKATRGAATVTHLANLGILDKNLLAVHCVYMTDQELELFAKHEVKVSYNPAAAMRVLGFAKIPEMLERGIAVSLGTDGAPANNRMTLIDDMWLASLLNKGRSLNPEVMPAETMLDMVTRNAAKCVLWDDEIGSLELGKQADLIVINPNTATMLPMHDPVANMVSSLRSDNVESTMVAGQWLMKNREILIVNESAILEEAKKRAAALKARAGIELKERFPSR